MGLVAFQCDITKMFLHFQVPEDQKDFLRFLWWKDRNTSTSPSHFRMTRHLFGAVSSMGCANIGLRAISEEYESQFGYDCGYVVRNSFYVDDCLQSVPSESEAIDLVSRLCNARKGEY